jgi:hypothetical protein
VWQHSREGFVCDLALRKLCGLIGIACEIPVDFRWPVNTCLRMVVLQAQCDAIQDVAWPLPSDRSFESIK